MNGRGRLDLHFNDRGNQSYVSLIPSSSPTVAFHPRAVIRLTSMSFRGVPFGFEVSYMN
jgi:hypothetical protein